MTRKNTQVRTVLSLSTLALIVTATFSFAGPLDPPAGPVASTYKTLNEVEPRTPIDAANTPGDADSLFKITQPGSYYLTGNITGIAAKHGIEIVSSGVTIDLNGFELTGIAGSLDGVSATVNGLRSIAVVNGSARSWGEDGIDLSRATLTGARLEGLRASNNGQDGLRVKDGSEVTHCVGVSNTRDGISIGDDSLVIGCSAEKNTRNGISANQGCVIRDCAVSQNGVDGILVNTVCDVRQNNCTLNGLASAIGSGIRVTGFGTRIEANNCVSADRGIVIETSGCVVIRNTCRGNTVSDWDVVAGNAILVIDATTTSAAIVGRSGGVAPGPADSNANYTY